MRSPETTKATPYKELLAQLSGLYQGERNAMANTANTAAALYHALPDINWAGFYFLHDDGLVLGPFQGKIACVRIAIGSGVCGTAAQRRETLIVPDVHEFPGHIACDAASRSEIVVPLIATRAQQDDSALHDNDVASVLGVLDIDSPRLARFADDDRAGLEAIARLLIESSDFL